MNPNPQAITQRYVSNLIHNGRNKDFDIDVLVRRSVYEGEEHVGYYFSVTIITPTGAKFEANGATPIQAIRRAMEKCGVTFR